MVEVFKTNVKDPIKAEALILKICQLFPHYRVNFDLEDCDNILRVETNQATVDADGIISLLKKLGFQSEILSDETINK
jgi:hypothetical protein